MLDRIFLARDVRHRIRGNPIGTVLEQFVEYLVQRGYRPGTVHQYMFAAEHFGHWLGRERLNLQAFEQFMSKHLPTCRCKKPAVCNMNCVRASLNRLREMLEIPTPSSCERLHLGTFSRRIVSDYEQHLREVQGLANSTIHFRLCNAAAMLSTFHVRSIREIRALRPQNITAFITKRLSGRSTAGGQVVTSATRSFLRFLLMRGFLTRDLTGVVLSPANWRLSGLPKVVDRVDLEKLIQTCCDNGSDGLAGRDRAILLCLIDLGLRASDVAALRMEGVEFVSGTLSLHCPKQRSTTVVPMTQRLLVALESYLCKSRPVTTPDITSRAGHLFVTHRAPVGRAMTASGIRNVVRRRAVQAGLQDRITGTHVIRHSVACTMLRGGASLKQIADLLGHRSIDTTSIYAKVDLGSLARVAMPWPESHGSAMREVTR